MLFRYLQNTTPDSTFSSPGANSFPQYLDDLCIVLEIPTYSLLHSESVKDLTPNTPSLFFFQIFLSALFLLLSSGLKLKLYAGM